MYNHLKSIIWMVIVLIAMLSPLTVASFDFDSTKYVEKPSLISYSEVDLKIYSTVRKSEDVLLVKSAASVLRHHEGFSSKPYRDSTGNWTQGYGRRIAPGKSTYISESQAYLWMIEDVTEIVAFFDENIPWWRKLNLTRQQVLINMGYNLGPNGLMKFDKFLNCLKTRQYTRASEMLLYTKNSKSKYWSQVGSRAVHLARAIKTGQWDLDEIRTFYG